VKDSFLCGVLSFFIPGLGQLFRGRFLAAIGWFLVAAFVDVLLHWTFILPVLVHLGAAFDAYRARSPFAKP
jgi:TM2 domain-containing membrane protein YozV